MSITDLTLAYDLRAVPESIVQTGVVNADGDFILSEAPDPDGAFSMAGTPLGGASGFVQQESIVSASGQYNVLYDLGVAQFHDSDIGSVVTATYSGIGTPVRAASVNGFYYCLRRLSGFGADCTCDGETIPQYAFVYATGYSDGVYSVKKCDVTVIEKTVSIGIALTGGDDGDDIIVQSAGAVIGVPGMGVSGARVVIGRDGLSSWISDTSGHTSGNYPVSGEWQRNAGSVILDGTIMLDLNMSRPIQVV